jgi:non-ribosomal peptide synthetase-like protein
VPPGPDRPHRRVISYAELDRQSDALAYSLRPFVRGECVVAILLPRTSEHLYLCQLAALKAGAAHACIDPCFPDEQVAAVLDDAQAVALLTDAEGLARARRIGARVEHLLDAVEWLAHPRRPTGPLEPASWLTAGSLAYLIYTSGTTGRPKGVMIEHAGIVNLVRGDLQEVGVTPQDRVAQSSSSAYDSSVEETWFALACGATLVVMDDAAARLGPDLVPWLRLERVTMLCPSPTLLRSTGCECPAEDLPDLRLVHVGGEALPADVAERWARGLRLVNDYGPTECTVTALRGQIESNGPISIGRPVPGLRAWVLNEALEEVPDGQQGELCLAGVGLARGYRNEPELTARKFPHHPRLGRLYRTGDLVHKGPDGNFYCHGRIDQQVKVRGYRIELEAIEARLAECNGVREAACRVQGEGARQKLVAFVVPEDFKAPPCFDELKRSLRKALPEYMVPSNIGALDKLPTTVSGKLNRRQLPVLEAHEADGRVVPPSSPLEERLELAFRKALGRSEGVSVHHDFFSDLGGNSLLAAQLISRLRDEPATAGLTVRDLYEARTVAGLAKRARPADEPPPESRPARATARPVLATLLQAAWLLLGLLLGAPIAYLGAFHVLPSLVEGLGWAGFLLLAPALLAAGAVVYTGAAAMFAVAIKKLLIGHYRPLRAPVWGSFYVRNWMVQQTVRLVPWSLLEGTVFQQVVLRALGARIGRRVHLHRGVDLLRGGWDLLEIGDDVTLSQDSSVRLVELEDGQVLVGPVTIGDGATLDVRAGVAGDTALGAGAYLTALSFLPRGERVPAGERWDGVPARPAGPAPVPPPVEDGRQMSPAAHGAVMLLARLALGLFVALPLQGLALLFTLLCGAGAGEWAFWLSLGAREALVGAALVALAVPLSLVFQALAMRALGRVREGTISRWGLSYVRVWLKADLVASAGRWLSGTLLWPVWLRCAGMKIGRGCEISTILDTIPELVEIGPETFFADGIYLGGPRIQCGAVILARTRLGTNTFLGNHAVVPAGQALPDDILLGVCTVADDRTVRPGTSWFGHPPFELPRREVVECDRSLTHDPSLPRYVSRVFWELLRFTLPLASVLLALAWFRLLVSAEAAVSLPVLLLAVLPLLELGVAAALCLIVLAMKWALLGRVKPGSHPLWSCWCSRWDFHYVAWDFLARGPLSALEGTLLLSWYVRAMGSRVGRGVVLGGGFAHVVDPDMLEIEDGATVNCLFQAHTFEDRVLKIDRVKVRRDGTVGSSAVLLYGADVGAGAYVGPHSVVMKHERLLPGRAYAGCPTRLVKHVEDRQEA